MFCWFFYFIFFSFFDMRRLQRTPSFPFIFLQTFLVVRAFVWRMGWWVLFRRLFDCGLWADRMKRNCTNSKSLSSNRCWKERRRKKGRKEAVCIARVMGAALGGGPDGSPFFFNITGTLFAFFSGRSSLYLSELGAPLFFFFFHPGRVTCFTWCAVSSCSPPHITTRIPMGGSSSLRLSERVTQLNKL